jgi:hypothetical protein
MNSTHAVRKTKGEGMGSNLSDDFEGSKVLFRELLGRSRQAEVFCLDKDLTANQKLWCRRSFCICQTLVSSFSFGDLLSEL